MTTKPDAPGAVDVYQMLERLAARGGRTADVSGLPPEALCEAQDHEWIHATGTEIVLTVSGRAVLAERLPAWWAGAWRGRPVEDSTMPDDYPDYPGGADDPALFRLALAIRTPKPVPSHDVASPEVSPPDAAPPPITIIDPVSGASRQCWRS